VVAAERRAAARAKAADRYATVPTFKEDMEVADDPAELEDGAGPAAGSFAAPARRPEASGSGRVAPATHSPVEDSKAAGRPQPSRLPRSKRGKSS